MNEALRIVCLCVWGIANVFLMIAGIVLWSDPTAPGGTQWPLGAGFFWCGVASTMFLSFVVFDIWH